MAAIPHMARVGPAAARLEALSGIGASGQAGRRPAATMRACPGDSRSSRPTCARAQPLAQHAAGVRARGFAVRRLRGQRDGVRRPARRERELIRPTRAPARQEARPRLGAARARRAADVLPLPGARGRGGDQPRQGRTDAPSAQELPEVVTSASSPSCSRRCPGTPRAARPGGARAALRVRAARERTGGARSRRCGPQQGLARVCGKGNKERLVPFGREAERAIRAYLPDRGAWRSHGRELPAGEPLFVNQRGGRLSDRSLRRILDAAVFRVAMVTHIHPHAAPRVRDAPARSRDGPARDPGAARPRVAVHDPALHAPRPRPPDGHLQQGAPKGVKDEPRAQQRAGEEDDDPRAGCTDP